MQRKKSLVAKTFLQVCSPQREEGAAVMHTCGSSVQDETDDSGGKLLTWIFLDFVSETSCTECVASLMATTNHDMSSLDLKDLSFLVVLPGFCLIEF